MKKKKKLIPLMPTHAGEILLDELLSREAEELFTPYEKLTEKYGKLCNIDYNIFKQLLLCEQNITEEIAEKLEKGLNIDKELWINIQAGYDADILYIELKNSKEVNYEDV